MIDPANTTTTSLLPAAVASAAPPAASPVPLDFSATCEFIVALVARGGPTPREFPVLDALMRRLPDLSAAQLERLREAFGVALTEADTMQGHAWLKPHGYAGDFEIIDRLYRERITADEKHAAWDRYFHAQPASRAVRNRKRYFHSVLDRFAARHEPVRVLNLASGPGRCMAEWLAANPHAPVSFDCVELDANAIEHARELTRPFAGRVAFQRQNVLRFTPPLAYDLIWAAGICDYFTAPIFARMLRRLLPALAPGGELIAGNFSDANPTRSYMEILGDWRLHHRSAEELRQIAISAGVLAEDIRVGAEPEGINLFLHIAARPGAVAAA
ncbi:MAG: hypothetical protein RLZZ15_3893 [Verrucomicrobiota bacterium]|jgi:SAM-dependent methyltransferase